MTQFKADVTLLTAADSGQRNPHSTIWSVLHTTESAEFSDPEITARWQQDTRNNSSYNLLVGWDGKTVRSNDDNFCPWSTGMPGNRLGIHISANGKASKTRAEWLKQSRCLDKIAEILADHHIRYRRPLKWLTAAEVKNNVPGVCSHGTYWQAIGRAQGMDFRSDPGDGFPHDVVLKRAQAIVDERKGGMKPPPPAAALSSRDVNSPMVRPIQDLILDQLTGYPGRQFPGWPQLGNRTLVDAIAAIGVALKLAGFKDVKKE